MPRNNLELPQQFSFSTFIPIRITDVNYGGHVGNDAILSLLHEARMQFLSHYGFSEKDLGGVGLIMSDVTINFKSEIFYGSQIRVSVTVSNLSRASFDIYYLIELIDGAQSAVAAVAKTGMICFNYDTRRPVSLPEAVRKKFTEV